MPAEEMPPQGILPGVCPGTAVRDFAGGERCAKSWIVEAGSGARRGRFAGFPETLLFPLAACRAVLHRKSDALIVAVGSPRFSHSLCRRQSNRKERALLGAWS